MSWYDKFNPFHMDLGKPTERGSIKILLVEDEASIAELYVHVLEKNGMSVKAISDPVQVVQVLQAESFDVMLLDLMMPKVNGLELMKSPPVLQTKDKMKIIVLTNLEQESIIKEAYALGASGYVVKAKLAPEQLVTVIKDTLNPPVPGEKKSVDGWFNKFFGPKK